MNKTIFRFLLFLSCFCVSVSVFAQEKKSDIPRSVFRTWSFGLQAGVISLGTIFNGKEQDFKNSEQRIAYSIYVKKQILPAFGIQLDAMAGKATGAQAASGIDPNGYFSYDYSGNSDFNTAIKWSGSLTAVYNIANISLNKEYSTLIPYLKAGYGYMQSDAITRGTPDQFTDAGIHQNWFIPTGLGLKLAVSRGINIDLGYEVHFIKSDNFDGFLIGGFDRFSYAHAGLEFSLGKKEKPQLQNYSQLANLKKETKEDSEALKKALSSAEERAKAEYEQNARDLADDDNDGVANKFDKCPGTSSGTTVDGSGCPIKPQNVPLKEITKEEVKDKRPVLSEQDKNVVIAAISNLEFEVGKATIRTKSLNALNRVADLVLQKGFYLKLDGYTDNLGWKELNLNLSKQRAAAVKAYLVSQGIDPSKIEATGHGSADPIASNDTLLGRQQNRRVEFTLY